MTPSQRETSQLPTIVKPPSNTPYLVAVVVMALLSVILVLGILYFRKEQDNTALITLVLGFLTTITTGILAFMKSQETHLSVNSRLDAFMREHSARIDREGFDRGVAVSEQVKAAAPSIPATLPVVAALPVIDLAGRVQGTVLPPKP